MSLKQIPKPESLAHLITDEEVPALAQSAGQLEHHQTMAALQDRRGQRRGSDRKANRRLLTRGGAVAAAGMVALVAAVHRQESNSGSPNQTGNVPIVEVVGGHLASTSINPNDATPAMRHAAEILANEGHVPSSP